MAEMDHNASFDQREGQSGSHRRDDGSRPSRGSKHLIRAQRLQIIALYVSGKTLRDIGAQFGRHPDSINRVIRKSSVKRHGQAFRRKHPARIVHRHMTGEQRRQAIALYAAGATIESLAVRFDRHTTTINQLIRKSGVERRGHAFRLKRNTRHGTTETDPLQARS
jgi:transposase-like protein